MNAPRIPNDLTKPAATALGALALLKVTGEDAQSFLQ